MSIEVMRQARNAFVWNLNTDLDNIPACDQWAKMLRKNIYALDQAISEAEKQNKWGGLTADEMLECLKAVDAATAVNLLMSQYKMPPTFKVYAEAIEAKLKEKNT
jgi:hypothetical protein